MKRADCSRLHVQCHCCECDAQTQEHKDFHNVGRILITALSTFSGGELMVETDDGQETVALSALNEALEQQTPDRVDWFFGAR